MLEQLTEQEFNDFAQVHQYNTFFQSSYWGKLKQATGWSSHMVGIKQNGKIIGATILLAKRIPVWNRFFFYAPRGFLIDYQDSNIIQIFTKEVAKYVKNQKGIFFKINPYVIHQDRDINGDIVEEGTDNTKVIETLISLGYKHNGYTIVYGKDLEPRWLSILDLTDQTEETLMKQMRATTRWGINNSYKHGLSLVEIDETRLSEFKDLMLHTGGRRGFIDRPLSYYQQMYEAFHPTNNIKIMLVELNTTSYLENLNKEKKELQEKMNSIKEATGAKGKRQYKDYHQQLANINKRIEELEQIKKNKGEKIVIAGGLFMTYGTQILSLFGASYREYMKFNGQFFLNYEMIKYALEHKYQKYNFYGITGEFHEESPMFGLFDFKRSFHADVVELIGEFTYITDPIYYKLYQMMFGIYKKMKKWRIKS